MSDWLGLNGRSAIVTGAALGIGRAVSQRLAAVGVDVMVADFNAEVGEETAATIRAETGTDTCFCRCDVTDRTEVDAMVATALDRYGRIDILVNNAGILIPRLLVDPDGKEELTEEIWDKVCAVNLKGSFLVAQAVARTMLADGAGGVVINMSSESGSEGSEGQSVYAATKAAGYNLSRSWAKELGKRGVRVVGVAPGIMEATALRSEEYERAVAYTRGLSPDEFRAKNVDVSNIPLQRAGRLEEVGDLICFLASDRAGYIHGTTVNISGGKSRA